MNVEPSAVMVATKTAAAATVSIAAADDARLTAPAGLKVYLVGAYAPGTAADTRVLVTDAGTARAGGTLSIEPSVPFPVTAVAGELRATADSTGSANTRVTVIFAYGL